VSALSRLAAPRAESDLAGAVSALFANPERAAPTDPLGAVAHQQGGDQSTGPPADARRFLGGPTGLGTSAARIPGRPSDIPGPVPVPDRRQGAGTSAGAGLVSASPSSVGRPAGGGSPLELFCPPAVRDDRRLGEEVNDGLLDWAEHVGIYPGHLDRLQAANFGRLIMLTHPATDDPDRLLAAGKCIVAEWATDDHFLDDESLGADERVIGSRLAISYAAVDPADLPARHAPELDEALSREPVAVAYRSAFEYLTRYATPAQIARLHHQLAVMFMAYNHEANWRATKRVPPVWEYLLHRHENSFLPPMVLVDPIAGYELPAEEFADPRVRRVICLAGSASVILNDLYSKSKESDADFDLPKVIAAEERCSAEEAIERTVEIHNELMHTFVAEASAISHLGSPALRRFLTDIWAWLGGNREWHSTTERYHDASTT